MPPLILAIDTAFSRCTAAVFDPSGDGTLRTAAEPEIGKGHAERLTGVIGDVLAEAGAGYRDLARIVVTTGPGSFTGIRVGVAAARGLALALEIPAVGISTLEALALGSSASSSHSAPDDHAGAPALAVLDARRGEVYAALYAANGSLMNGPAALRPEAMSDFIEMADRTTPLRLVGSGAEIAQEWLGNPRTIIASTSDRIDPETLARLGAEAPADAPPRPLYLRGADAKPSSAPSLRERPAESISHSS